ncbi:Retron-type RNA-directed DNA polymerase [Minicystis rosea]|nr:Retron-type RNA-directed DNA polymerase [Minicystis rosea]
MLLRLIDKWLAAGVLEDHAPRPLTRAARRAERFRRCWQNIHLHEALDVWLDREVEPHMSGRAQRVRYTDDVVPLFAHERDARREMAVLPKRFGNRRLTLHPEQTRLWRR